MIEIKSIEKLQGLVSKLSDELDDLEESVVDEVYELAYKKVAKDFSTLIEEDMFHGGEVFNLDDFYDKGIKLFEKKIFAGFIMDSLKKLVKDGVITINIDVTARGEKYPYDMCSSELELDAEYKEDWDSYGAAFYGNKYFTLMVNYGGKEDE